MTSLAKRQFGAAFLLAGTAIGSGMISLPMVLAKFGIFGTFITMIAFALLTYFTALIRSDLNLNSHAEASLKDVGNFFECSFVGSLGDFMLKLLSFALLSAYISGESSIIDAALNHSVPNSLIVGIFTLKIALVFLWASKVIVNANRILFIGMFATLIGLIAALLWQTPIKFVPQQSDNISLNEWTTLVPVIFTSFGFQGSIHSMTKFCENDRNLIKNACLWGSVIPAIVYIAWTSAILIVVANTDSAFFNLMLEGKAQDVGSLVRVLSQAASSQSIQIIVWIISGLAILTSIFGVGLALLDIFQREWHVIKLVSIFAVFFVPAVISVVIPNAFIRILNISGIILAIIAIIVPVIISFKMQSRNKVQCKLLLKNKAVMLTVFAIGIAIIMLGVMDIVR